MTGSLATTSIITRGLSGGKAQLGLISSFVSLYIHEAPPPVVVKQSGGGPYPGPNVWNVVKDIQNFYKPVQPWNIIPRDDERTPKSLITLKINFNGRSIEKIYEVPANRRKLAVRVFGVINATQKRYAITMGRFKRIASQAKIKIRALKLKSSKNDK